MDIEQLKLVLESLDNVTDGAKTIALWWIAGKTVVPVIGWAMLLFGVIKTTGILLKTAASWD